MINVTALVQLKAFARQDGVILALTWIASFILMIYTPQYSYGNLLALSTPFIVGWRLCAFFSMPLMVKSRFVAVLPIRVIPSSTPRWCLPSASMHI